MQFLTPLRKTFSASLSRFSILPEDKIVAAVSGGADSVCLLHLFLKTGFLSSLHVAHLNHGFRKESDQEALFVANLCQSWGIPCTVAKRNVLETCKTMHLSKQEGARLVRYAFLHEVATAQEASFIALGHTADDQVETLLINRLRGAGVSGLCGMAKMRDDGAHVIIRPMLSITRNEIIAELKGAQIKFVEDPSNQDRRYLRNRVRHELIPLLSAYNPRIRETLLREAMVLEGEDDFIETHLANLLPTLDLVFGDDSISFDISLFSSLHPGLTRRVLRWGIRRLRGSCRNIKFEHIEAILTKIPESANGKRLCLPDRIFAAKEGSRLILSAAIPVSKKISVPEFEIPMDYLNALTDGAREIDLPQWKMRLALCVAPPSLSPPPPSPCSMLFDFDTISFPLTVRGFRRGDRFCPLGMKGRHKKLQDFFVDMKIPKEKRDQIPLLVCPAGIIFVIGQRQDERFKVTKTTKRVLSIQIKPKLRIRKI